MNKPEEKFTEIPFAFFGMGLFRAWTETVYANSLIEFPSQESIWLGFLGFNILTAVILIGLAMMAKRIVSLHGRAEVAPVTGACLVVSASLNFASIYIPNVAYVLGVPAVLLGAFGMALILLLWSELFSCLSPLRVGLYFSGGLMVGAFVLWLFKGLAIPWLWVCVCLVPVASLVCLKRSYVLLGQAERPHASWGEKRFPWRPIAIVGLYSFTYGLCENVFGDALNIHSGLGCVAAALLVFVAIQKRKDDFSYSFTYKAACPLMIVSLVPFTMFVSWGGAVSAFFALAAYTLVLIAIMVIVSNLCYQHGFNAIWLFGIERAVRLLTVQAGIATNDFLKIAGAFSLWDRVVVSVLAAVLIVVATKFFLSEASLTSSWGTTLHKINPNEPAFNKRLRVEEKCKQVANSFGLTSREEEVLVLLMLGRKPAAIAEELYVAQSTVKTHTKHIYQKLDVHSKKKLCVLVGIDASGTKY